MAQDFDAYRELIPLALSWLLGIESNCLTDGRALTDAELQDAYAVGVRQPEKIRVLSVDRVAQPDDPRLLEAAIETGLLGENASARAVGYGIEVVIGRQSRKLLRHEFRHVYQFEQAGSLENFISAYIQSVLTHGYTNSEFEQDARAYEDVSAAVVNSAPSQP